MEIVKRAVIVLFILAFGFFLFAQIREVQKRDETVPVIESDRDVLEVSCDYEEKDLLEGLTASDAKDGDLTSQILVGDISRFVEKGVSNVTYVVFDSGNQPASLTRRVKFKDYRSPRFYLSQPLVFYEEEGSFEELKSRVTAKDVLNGDRTEWIVQLESDVNFEKAGDYHVSYEVSNSYGDNVAMQLPVHILEGKKENLEIRLTENIVYLDRDDVVNTEKWLEGVYDSYGDKVDSVSVSAAGKIDNNKPGVYEIQYLAEDEKGNRGETWLTVVVKE